MAGKPDPTGRARRPHRARRLPFHAALLGALALGACDRFGREEAVEEPAAPVLTLKVATPEVLYWGGSGMLHLTLANEGPATAAGGIVEVFVPAWLEFGTVEPAGTAVTVVSGDTETTLRYQFTDSLAPGDSRLITQHLRVLPRTVVPQARDSLETVELEPPNQLVRARLLTLSGEAIGVEVQASLNFVAGAGAVPTTIDTTRARRAPPRDTADTAAARTRADTAHHGAAHPDTVPLPRR